jgi:hypothetical protein
MAADYRAHLRQRLIECDVPGHLHEGLIEYIAARREVGQFLRAVLSNDLKEACAYADAISSVGLKSIVLFLYNFAPGPCWGSPQHVDAWLADPDVPAEVYE